MMELEKIDRIIDHACKLAGGRLTVFEKCSIDKYGTTVFTIHGGLNGALYGTNKWAYYFDTLSKFTQIMYEMGFHIWNLNVDNDAIDDLFTAKFGIRQKKEPGMTK